MGMFNFVLDSFKGEIFGFKVKRQDLIAGTVYFLILTVILFIPSIKNLFDISRIVSERARFKDFICHFKNVFEIE